MHSDGEPVHEHQLTPYRLWFRPDGEDEAQGLYHNVKQGNASKPYSVEDAVFSTEL